MPLSLSRVTAMAKRSRSSDSRSSKHSTRGNSPALPSPSSPTIPIDSRKKMDPKPVLPKYLRLSKAEVRRKFEELDDIQRHRIIDGHASEDGSHQFSLDLDNAEVRARNRYLNVTPWTNHRVRLNVPEGKCDFINASPISVTDSISKQETKYIATQGPKFGQHSLFWNMVFHQTKSVAVIVMLTQTFEGGREKCAQYFPFDMDDPVIDLVGPASQFSDPFTEKERDDTPVGTLELLELSHDDTVRSEIRKMELTFGDETKTVWHFLFAGWADYGKPVGDDRQALLELIKLSAEKSEELDNPRIVHCSAGVGRTGTFIALDHLLRELENGSLLSASTADPRADAVFDTVNCLREQRMLMVYNEMQLDFIYEVLKEQVLIKQGVRLNPASARGEPSPKMPRRALDIEPLSMSSSTEFLAKPELVSVDQEDGFIAVQNDDQSDGFTIENWRPDIPIVVEPKSEDTA